MTSSVHGVVFLAQDLGYHVDRDAGVEHRYGHGVPEIMEADLRQPGRLAMSLVRHFTFVLFPPVHAHWQLALSKHELCQGGEFRSNLAQWSYLRDEGPLLGPEPDYHLPDSGLHDLPDPEFGVPDLLPGLVCRPSWGCPLWPSTPGQSHAPSPAA
jgi:hypothetical protein